MPSPEDIAAVIEIIEHSKLLREGMPVCGVGLGVFPPDYVFPTPYLLIVFFLLCRPPSVSPQAF